MPKGCLYLSTGQVEDVIKGFFLSFLLQTIFYRSFRFQENSAEGTETFYMFTKAYLEP